ncbi:MAG: RsmE family RNA methyltransferase [Phycisphaerales bacterium]
MSSHRFYIDEPWARGKAELTVRGEEARHAVRVKRLGVGDAAQVLDGRGHVADARIEGVARSPADGHWEVRLSLGGVTAVEPVRPRIEVWSAVPKGARLGELIDAVSQVGAALWRPLETRHGIAEPGGTKMDRVRRIAVEASKQCERAWAMEVADPARFDDALRDAPPDSIILADAGGEPYRPSGAASQRLLIGPEGGWAGDELDRARSVGVRIARFGPHVMRIETAAVVACAIILHRESRAP